MKRFNLELLVGIFMVVGFLCFAWLAVKLGDVELFGDKNYTVQASFGSIAGLKEGAAVEVAGVQIGRVTNIRLDQEFYEAVVKMSIDKEVGLTVDSIASIRTAGILGDRYVSISPGGAPDTIEPGGRITETESAINLEELISKYVFENN